MKAVMLSIKPKWCELIASGKKTIEVCKTKPKLETPFKCYIYCTKGRELLISINGVVQKIDEWVFDLNHDCHVEELNGKVIGEFVCDTIKIYPYEPCNDGEHLIPYDDFGKICMDGIQLYEYLRVNNGYGWHISDMVIYDKPKELSEFMKPCKYGDESDVSCFLCDKSGYAPDMHIDCFNTVIKPPQSWCYVERI